MNDPSNPSKQGLSFIIPYRANEVPKKLIQAIEEYLIDFPFPNEIFLISGNHPPLQRNKAIKKSTLSHLYFLDNDSIVNKKSLDLILKEIKKNNFDVLGGPSILPKKEKNKWQHLQDAILSNPFAVGKISCRYRPRGKKKKCFNDLSLILCNLVVKKKIFNEVGLFNEKLYPNEENEFFNRVIKKKKKIIYDPNLFVFRNYRHTFKAFIKQMLFYGRGRAEQIKIKKRSFKIVFLAPILLTTIIIFFPLVLFLFFINENVIFFFLPFFLSYFILLIIAFLEATIRKKKNFIFFPIIFICCHFFYGFGMIKGFLTKKYSYENKKIHWKITKI